ncbi:MAG: WG repeat-containing protein [Bryobacteraceae bacterium]
MQRERAALRSQVRFWIHALFCAVLLNAVVHACSVSLILWSINDKSADPLFRFIRGGKAGYIDAKGRIVVSPTLAVDSTSFAEFHEGLLRIGGEGNHEYVDKTGKVQLRIRAWMASDFSEGLAAVSGGDSFGAKVGFVDHSGRFVISPQYYSAESFSEGLAVASLEGHVAKGYIDRYGNWVVQPRLAEARPFHESLAAVIIEGPCRITNGGSCERSEYAPLLANAKYDCRFAFIDKTGNPVSDLRFDDAKDFSEGLAAIRIGRKWGFIDKKGRISIPAEYESAEPFSEGLAAVRHDGMIGFIDASGSFVIAPRFEYAGSFSDGRAIVSDRSPNGVILYRFISRAGMPAFSGWFVHAAPFVHGLAPVAYEVKGAADRGVRGRFAWIDVSGNPVLAFNVR